MGETLKQLRDMTIIIGIYLYFIAWVYVHFYYSAFGISTESLKIDYSSYLVYSYDVLISAKFLFWVKIIVSLILLRMVCLWIIAVLQKKNKSFQKIHVFLSSNAVITGIKQQCQRYSRLLLIVILVIIFPLLYSIARDVAKANYLQFRTDTSGWKNIQFSFRKDAGPLSPTVVLDSTLPRTDIFYTDIKLLKNDTQQLLRLIGESEKYYIVLQQRPVDSARGMPRGYVYFINRDDVLLSKIILPSR